MSPTSAPPAVPPAADRMAALAAYAATPFASLDEAINQTLALLADLTGISLTMIHRLEGDTLVVSHACDRMGLGIQTPVTVRRVDTFCDTVLKSLRPLIVPDADAEPRWRQLLGLTILRQRLLGLPAFGHHHHDHDHSHDHGHDEHVHAHAHGLAHSYDGHGHSHLPPGADGERLTWRGLLALGICGALQCCNGTSVNLATDAAHCGECNFPCATGSCVHGACTCQDFTDCECDACGCSTRKEGGKACTGVNIAQPCTTDTNCPLGSICRPTNVCAAPCTGCDN